MTQPRQPIPPELVARINEIGRECALAGLTQEEALAVVNTEARKHGLEFRPRT